MRVLLLALSLACAGCGSGEDAMLVHVTASAEPALLGLLAAWDQGDVDRNVASTQVLVRQLERGAPGDVAWLADDRLEGEPSLRLRRGLALYARGDDWRRGRFGLASEGVPIGDYARAALRGLGALERVAAGAVILPHEPALRAALRAGTINAAILYEGGDAGDWSVEPLAVRARYAVYLLSERPEARAFVAWLRTTEARELLAHHGFEVDGE